MAVPVVYSETYRITLPGFNETPLRFDGPRLVAEQLVSEGILARGQLISSPEIETAELQGVHPDGYLAELLDPTVLARALEIELPREVSPAAIEAGVLRPMRRIVGGTRLAVMTALESGMAIHLAGGYHHALPAHGQGGCLFADVPIALRALPEDRFPRTLIVDLDGRHGDGNATCYPADMRVRILDFYDVDSFPYEMLPVWRKVEFARGVGDAEYLERLERELPDALDGFEPLLVIYLAGGNVLADEPGTHMQLSPEGVLARNRFVIEQVRGRGIPLVVLPGGGETPAASALYASTIRWTIERYGG